MSIKMLLLILLVNLLISLFNLSANQKDSLDPECLHFGFDSDEKSPLIPVAVSLFRGTCGISCEETAKKVYSSIRKNLELAGIFYLVPADRFPQSYNFEWSSVFRINFHEWISGGSYLLIMGSASRCRTGSCFNVETSLYLVEEGQELSLPEKIAALSSDDDIEKFANQWVNRLLLCLTGKPGLFGTRLVYIKRINPKSPKEVFVSDMNGKNEKKIASYGEINLFPSWGTDGSISYIAYEKGRISIYINEKPFPLKFDSQIDVQYQVSSGIVFSPDGKYFAVTLSSEDGNSDIFLVRIEDGKIVRRLTDYPGIDTSPSFSPDGKSITFVSDRTGTPQLFIMDIESGQTNKISVPYSYVTSPDWSPSGDEIAFNFRTDGDKFAIGKIAFPLMQFSQLTSGLDCDEDPSYSPDGKYILFTSNRSGVKKLYIMDSRGRGQKSVTNGSGEFFTPAWGK
jgi:TolB protein